ncbi:DUF1254 domain-containing protein [Parasphingopyxis algicola]|uniref:DUF1254 domain-containing protein n=1 Tax=Parasphingopyxis algicola TaxID=2026624 RepID=UPI0015A22C42|nr:DUF1254 domain-containing protein [Parasphingopyxis algicola]QLC24510.1 DUF1254 domain-containing protein [Parasphingopyxis algicola]
MLRPIGWIVFVAAVAMLAYWTATALIPGTMMHLAMGRLEQNAGVNTMGHAPLSTAERRIIVRPSPDLAYSTCLFDLAEGPVEITVAPIGAPYWSLSVYDERTNAVFVRNDRDANGGPLRIALARAGQAVPDGLETVRLSSDRGLALVRILVPERDAFAAIDTDRRSAGCAPLGRRESQ